MATWDNEDDRRDRRRRLEQIRTRCPDAEGVFWCSTVTTGVYCRPTCPSRRARPEHIRLHDTLDAARATGFRPCGRCRPEEPSLADQQRAAVDAACRRLANEGPPPPAAELAQAAGLSLSRFYKVFRRVTGDTPGAYARRARPAAQDRSPSGKAQSEADAAGASFQ